jgi:hypothetical protein
MRHLSKILYSAALLAALGSSQGWSATMNSVWLEASLSAANEVPANGSSGSGKLEASLNQDSLELSYSLSYTGLSGPVKAGHFHGPAPAGSNAGVVLPLSGSLASPIQGEATLTPEQAADLLAGKWYVNLHTAANPGGEIRGQALRK